jgi:transcription-repair coupling factor
VSIWRSLTEISYELANTPLFYKNRLAFYLTAEERDVLSLKSLCQFWNPLFPINNIVSEKFYTENKITDKEYLALALQLAVGEEMALSDIVAKLVALAYERNTTANQEKTFSVRGDVLDIFLNDPMRVQFEGNKIQKIFSFSLESNKKNKDLKELHVYPQKIPASSALMREDDLHGEFVSPKFYNMRFKELNHDLNKYLKILIFTKQAYKISKIITQRKTILEDKGDIELESFILPKENTIFLTDENIFGAPLIEEKKEADQNFLDNLQPGDYVVHIDHGVAQFAGYKEIKAEKYFFLQYAHNDKLFVPFTSGNRLEPYIGSVKPKLHRLDDASWEQILNKIKKKTEVIAKDLLNIYAQREVIKAPIFKEQSSEKELWDSFPYPLTPDQEQSLIDTLADLGKEKPADRLICGDVGFGKTEIAMRASFRAVLNGYQVAILCPTTILVQQHYDTFCDRLKKFGVSIELLSRFKSGKQQKEAVNKIKSGHTDIIIATHRLLSKDIAFNKLGLIIVDEEQKFGVKHKEFFKKIKSEHAPHVLTLTATPIPRTLNLALSGLREISVIRTPPPHRLKIKTIIAQESEQIIKQAVEQELNRKGQVYFLYNKVETINFIFHKLQKLFPKARIAVAHGQMEPKQLAGVMHDFDEGKTDILICSTIIENGLDIANANTLIVHNAPNFGLSQLHQIRGRIGRSYVEAYAYLLYEQTQLTMEARKRLKALTEFSGLGSGMELAMKDLELRGVGNILGKAQSGQAEEIGLNLYLRLLNTAIKELKSAGP